MTLEPFLPLRKQPNESCCNNRKVWAIKGQLFPFFTLIALRNFPGIKRIANFCHGHREIFFRIQFTNSKLNPLMFAANSCYLALVGALSWNQNNCKQNVTFLWCKGERNVLCSRVTLPAFALTTVTSTLVRSLWAFVNWKRYTSLSVSDQSKSFKYDCRLLCNNVLLMMENFSSSRLQRFHECSSRSFVNEITDGICFRFDISIAFDTRDCVAFEKCGFN